MANRAPPARAATGQCIRDAPTVLRRMKSTHADILATLLMGSAMAAAMLAPTPDVPAPHWADKIVHAAAFAALTLPLAMTRRVHALALITALGAFGAAIELLQPQFGRHAEWGDWIADVLGAVACLAAVRLTARLNGKTNNL